MLHLKVARIILFVIEKKKTTVSELMLFIKTYKFTLLQLVNCSCSHAIQQVLLMNSWSLIMEEL